MSRLGRYRPMPDDFEEYASDGTYALMRRYPAGYDAVVRWKNLLLSGVRPSAPEPKVPKEKKCIVCGIPFPPNAPGSKKYCRSCAEQRNREQTKMRQAKRAKERAAREQIAMSYEATQKRDREYCGKCKYSPAQTESFLCQYILIAGERRGCAVGYGCTKRELRAR